MPVRQSIKDQVSTDIQGPYTLTGGDTLKFAFLILSKYKNIIWLKPVLPTKPMYLILIFEEVF